MLQPDESSPLTVVVNESTSVQRSRKILRSERLSADVLKPGLRVRVDGTYETPSSHRGVIARTDSSSATTEAATDALFDRICAPAGAWASETTAAIEAERAVRHELPVNGGRK